MVLSIKRKEEFYMLVKKDIEGNTYKKLVKYALQNCDCVLLKKYHDQNAQETERAQKVIFSYKDFTAQKVIENYSTKFLKAAEEFFMNNSDLFNQEYLLKFETNYLGMNEKDFLQLRNLNRKHRIVKAIDRYIYDTYEKNG